MAGFGDLAREYEARRFPPRRRLDLQAEGPSTARERALRWIQSYAHEEPGQELLLIVERGNRPGRPAGPVRHSVEKLLTELEGGLVAWWQRFGEGSLAVRLADDPHLTPSAAPHAEPSGEGRTAETAGTALLALHHDIPEELLELAGRVAEMRRHREGISVGLLQVVLRRVWIEAQADAMSRRLDFSTALQHLLEEEKRELRSEN